ncbi:ABC-three component system middle component 1 [Bacillus sp. FSL L8-0099]|uniref:ABC-three component system middle component 1 n=1 Tax=unclassified Bacillus (in: firmicutes) TaxID=185979 RepID=UPI0030FACD8D
MKLIIKEDIKEILSLDGESQYDKVKCFQYIDDQGKYKFYIFTCYYDLEEELKNDFRILNDIIAYDFQRKLMLDIEKWNIYIFFFAKEIISEELKNLIEQNKYATRKIVFDNISKELSNSEIEKIIFNKLFFLDLSPEEKVQDQGTNAVQDIISRKDLLLMDLITEIKEIEGTNKKEFNQKKVKAIKKYLEMKMDE